LLSLLSLIHRLVEKGGSQFVIATHSPILLAYPAAQIYRLGGAGIAAVAYEDTEHFQITRDFLNHRDRYFATLSTTPSRRAAGTRLAPAPAVDASSVSRQSPPLTQDVSSYAYTCTCHVLVHVHDHLHGCPIVDVDVHVTRARVRAYEDVP